MWNSKILVTLILSALSLLSDEAFAACTFQPIQDPYAQNIYLNASLNQSSIVSISGLVAGSDVTCEVRRQRPPAGQVVLSGCQGGFTANASTPPVNFEVPFNWSIPSVGTNDAGDYTFVIRANCGGTLTTYETNPARVTVNPQITIHPTNLTLGVNQSGNMNVLADNDFASNVWTYKWKFNGVDIVGGQGFTGFNTRTLTFTTPQTLLKASAPYYVSIDNPHGAEWGTASSSYAEFYLATSNPQGDGLCRSGVGFVSGPDSYDDYQNSSDGILQIGGTFRIQNGYYFNGLGDCSNYGGNLFYCTDPGRTPSNFYIQVSDPLILTSDIDYLRGSTVVASFDDRDWTSPFTSFERTLAQTTDNGNYFLRVNNGPCQAAAITSTANVPINVIQAPVATIDSFTMDRYDHTNAYIGTTTAPGTGASIAGGRIEFNVSVSGSGPFTYQLVKDGVNFGNPQASGNFSIPFPTLSAPAHQGSYLVRVTNSGGTVSSSVLTLNVNPQPPSAAYIDPDVQRPEGSQMVYTTTVLPLGVTGLSYQWQRSSDNINWTTVGTSSDYIFTVGTPGVSYYRVRVQNASNAPNWIVSNTSTFTSTASAPTINFQPQAIAVTDGQAYFFQVGATGSPTLSYAWERRANAGSPFVSVGGNSNIFSGNAQFSDNGAQFRVTVSNGIPPNAVSTIVTLTVNPSAPVITTHPAPQTVVEGNSTNFFVVATGSPPLTYQWQESLNGGSSWSNISGATGSALNFIAQTSQNNRLYRVIVSRTGLPSATSNSALLTVNPVNTNCPAPSQVVLSSPSNDPGSQSPVSPNPVLSWQPVNSPAPGCAIDYRVQISTSPPTELLPTVNVTGTNYAPTLFPSTQYYWRVRAVATANTSSTQGPWSSTWQLVTLPELLPAPTNLATWPATSLENPSGNQQILLEAYSGTPGATGIFYLKRPEGDVEVGQTLIGSNPGGNFQISIDVTAFSALSGPREYYARQVLGNLQSPVSTTVVYHYQAGLVPLLPAPTLEKNIPGIVGSLKWRPVAGTERYYNVYRRVGLEIPTQDLYLNSKPFRRVATNINPAPVNGFITWQDPQPPTSPAPHGVSYFVTTVQLNPQLLESERSNSQSFADTVAPKRSREVTQSNLFVQQFEFLTLSSGTSASGFLLGVPNPPGFFHHNSNTPITNLTYDCNQSPVDPDRCKFFENSPDMIALVQVKEKDENISCLNENFSVGAQSYVMPFDALNVADNKIPIGEVGNLIPNTLYCISACLKDKSDNSEGAQCLPPAPFFASYFDGVTSVTPHESGTALNVDWEPPTANSVASPPILYIVEASENFDSEGNPVFDTNTVVRQIDPNETETILTGLKTNTRYAVRVQSIDEGQNSTGADVYRVSQTLNNIPYVPRVIVEADTKDPWKMNISFSVLDRQRDDVRIDQIFYRSNKFENWIQVNGQHISGNSFYASGDTLGNAPVHSTIFDTLSYFSGQQPDFQVQLKIVDTQGNETYAESERKTALYAMSKNSSYVSYSGCTSAPINSKPTALDLWPIILGLMGLGAWIRKRRFT